MRMHYLQHVPFEGLGNIASWVRQRGHSLSVTRLFHKADLPDPATIDGLVVMGGPMSVNQEDKFPWLVDEKKYLSKCIALKKPLLGICLGSQLLAEVLGATVYSNRYKEIGWFPIELNRAARQSPFFHNCPHRLKVFHWHGDTYDLPDGAHLLASSEACRHQAFIYDELFMGIQFHLEVTSESIASLVKNGTSDLTQGKYVQEASHLYGSTSDIETVNGVMVQVLDNLFFN